MFWILVPGFHPNFIAMPRGIRAKEAGMYDITWARASHLASVRCYEESCWTSRTTLFGERRSLGFHDHLRTYELLRIARRSWSLYSTSHADENNNKDGHACGPVHLSRAWPGAISQLAHRVLHLAAVVPVVLPASLEFDAAARTAGDSNDRHSRRLARGAHRSVVRAISAHMDGCTRRPLAG
jgi:hypothetical protein